MFLHLRFGLVTGLVFVVALALVFNSQPVDGQTNEKQHEDSSCSSPLCSCCLDTVQCPTDGQCYGQCRDGYFGGKCKNTCPDNCVRCRDPDNPNDNDPRLWAVANCTACKDGYYSTSEYFQCQFDCPDGCQTCSSDTECTSCKPGYTLEGTTCKVCKTGCAICSSYDNCTQCQSGYFNSGGTAGNLNCVECSKGCNDQCDNTTGTCTCYTPYTGSRCESCASGYYKNGEYCSKCVYPCVTCTSATTCTSCAVEHYLNGDNCQPCNTGCAQCSSGGNCDKCKDYYYYNSGGVSGNLNCVRCGGGCKDDQCDPATGNCTCRTQLHTVPKCDGCIDGYYMSSQKYCYQCRVSNCAKCTSQDTCTSCVDGYFYQGTACYACRPECAQCSTYDICTDCKDGYYKNGTGCVSCSTSCSDVCNKATGTCNCKENYAGEKCDRCVDGKHGTYCTLNCSGGCQICSSATQCSVCHPGVYGDTCDKNCPANCRDQICDKTNGTCTTCKDGFQGDNCTVSLASSGGPGEGGPPTAAIAGGVVGGVVVIILVVVVVIFLWRRSSRGRNKQKDDNTRPINKERVYENGPAFRAVNDSYESETPSESLSAPVRKAPKATQPPAKREKPASEAIEKQKAAPVAAAVAVATSTQFGEYETDEDNVYYSNVKKGVSVRELASYVDKKNAEFFTTEFNKLPKGLIKDHDEALKDHNLGKNRYNGIYPYDETRVILEEPGSDFINACYIEGYRKRREYIASLGPIAKATEGYSTFWRMVWQEKTEKIVMVTNLMENMAMKCEQYWPDKNTTTEYGDIRVTCHSQDMYAEYTVRSFAVRRGKEERSLHHIHYTAWPDKGVPDDVTSMIEFRSKVNATKVKLGGPVIVHCSAGVGRTGTYIALDIQTVKGNKEGYVDIFDCVVKLRKQRTTLVQTAEQYEYVHRALVHSLTLGSEAIPAEKFQMYASTLPDTVFDKLSHCKEKVRPEETAAVERNKALKDLNRQGADIPGDNNRPRLFLGKTAEENNYINAVFVNSFKLKNQFIMTQSPLPSTVNDFLTMVVQEKSSCIVSMDPVGLSDKTIGTYIPPDNQELQMESFKVRCTKVDSRSSFTIRTLEITAEFVGNTTTHTVQHYQISNWLGNAKAPASSEEFLKLVNEVQKTAEEGNSTVIVHCRNGSERSGLLCVVVSLLQKMEIEHEVSVINTVRQVKLRRPQAIPTKEQFAFCHECVSAYLQTFDIYANFS